ncbi:MAG TPA: type IX secretion system membrane protein PorP/SprF [Bacteroidales bacterium]|nr:type IX secretion system membrane protein PorP/SprF [Bacteroidales bacterium]
MRHFRLISVVFNTLIWGLTLSGQETPINPISYRVYDMYVLNPAIAGSKDYFLVDGVASFQGSNKSQLITANSRIYKKSQGFFSSPASKAYTNFGIGGSIFNDVCDTSKSIGFSLGSDYHIRLNKQATSFLSVGFAVKGIYNRLYSAFPPDGSSKPQEKYLPNIDLGAYYYSPAFYAGISATNLLGSDDTLGIPVKPQYFLIAGYKFILSRAQQIAVEPSIIAHTGDTLSKDIRDIFNPAIKVYIQSFCVGTYFHNYDNFSFFFQYNFPALSVGTYFEYPKKTAFYKKELIAELTIGLNVSKLLSGNKNPLHW